MKHTLQSFEVWGSFPGSTNTVGASVLPVSPAGHVLQTCIVVSVLEVLGAHEANSSTGIDEVVEVDNTGGAVLLGPGCGDGLPGVLSLFSGRALAAVRDEVDPPNFDSVEDFGTALLGVAENQLIGFRADDVPRVAVWSSSANEVGNYSVLAKRIDSGRAFGN